MHPSAAGGGTSPCGGGFLSGWLLEKGFPRKKRTNGGKLLRGDVCGGFLAGAAAAAQGQFRRKAAMHPSAAGGGTYPCREGF